MVRVEERVAHLEGQMNELSQGLLELKGTVRHLEQRVDARFDAVDRRFDAFDARFDAVGRRFDALDDKVSRQFVWLVGIIVTTLVAMVGAVLSRG